MTAYEVSMLKMKKKQLAFAATYIFPLLCFFFAFDLGLGCVLLGLFGEVFNVSFYLLDRQVRRLESA